MINTCTTEQALLKLKNDWLTRDSQTDYGRLDQPTESNLLDPQYDAWVLAGGSLFRAHSYILAAHSPFLRAAMSALGEPRVVLPHVSAEGFASILAYMYTGRLAVTPVSFYEVLITSNILQMPHILALAQATIAATTPVISVTSLATTKPPDSHIISTLPPALSAWKSLAKYVPSTSGLFPLSNNSTIIKPTPKRLTIHNDKNDNRRLKGEIQQVQRYIMTADMQRSRRPLIGSSDGDLVMDVAVCDGPVFFERVLNKANSNDSEDNTSEDDEPEINVVDEIEAENSDDIQQAEIAPEPKYAGNKVYHCVYCSNNFKSHYCYQKHMRRHINPITVEEDRTDEPKEDNANQIPSTSSEQPRTLDLNVQYFPCKTCGSKFPSYYFVHKHRRICHRDQESKALTTAQPEEPKPDQQPQPIIVRN